MDSVPEIYYTSLMLLWKIIIPENIDDYLNATRVAKVQCMVLQNRFTQIL